VAVEAVTTTVVVVVRAVTERLFQVQLLVVIRLLNL
jgi:hypothetical protein